MQSDGGGGACEPPHTGNVSAFAWTVAVVGAASEVGREVLAVLDERGAPVSEWRLYDTTNEGSESDGSEFPAPLQGADVISMEGVDVAFLCGPNLQAGRWAEQARRASALCIDVLGALVTEGAALVVPEVNGEVVDDGDRFFACPAPGAAALAIVLQPLEVGAALKRVVVTALEPVSIEGTAGVDELARQTRELLTGASTESEVFPHRVAFNLIPHVGDPLAGGRTSAEWAVELQTRALLDLPDLPILVTSVSVPTFYGSAYIVQVETEQPLDSATARELLRCAPGILLSEEGTYPTLVEVIGSEATLVGRIRDDHTVAGGVVLWAAIDGLRKGGAVNAVQIAERALRTRT